jgi:hypothetical protein
VAVRVDREPRGAVAGGRTPLAEARAGARLLRDVAGFRRFLLARGLLAVTEVAVPFWCWPLARRASTPPASARSSRRRGSRRCQQPDLGTRPTGRPTGRGRIGCRWVPWMLRHHSAVGLVDRAERASLITHGQEAGACAIRVQSCRDQLAVVEEGVTAAGALLGQRSRFGP